MSQAGVARISSGNLPPQVPINFVTGAGTATPALGILQILGVTSLAGNIPVSTSAPGSSNIVDISIQTSQAIAGSDATKIGLSAFNSAQFTVDANGFVSARGSSIGQTITGNTGGALSPTAGNWNIVTANSTVLFAGSGSTLTQDFSLTNLAFGSTMPVVTSGTSNIGIGPAVLATLTSGTSNIGIGYLSLQAITTATGNVVIGFGSGRFLTTGTQNVLVGSSAGTALTQGNNNTVVGYGALNSYTTGTANAGSNVAVGEGSLSSIITGINNICVGVNSGASLTLADSGNICIGNTGTAGDANTMRLGTQGSGSGQLQTYIAGVVNTVSGRVVKTTVPGAYPYTTLTTDYVILVDTSSARTINLIGSPVTGTTYRIKDNVGSAASNNITIIPAAGTIDGAASYVISSNWGSVDLVYNSTAWRIL
jgi:hypothetical protein